MKQPQVDTAALWSVALVGPHGEHVPGTVVRCIDDIATVVIGVGLSRDWHTGDLIQIYSEAIAASQSPRRGRVYSTYKSLGADHVVIDLSELSAPLVSPQKQTPADERAAVRVRPQASNPLVALLIVGRSILEGRACNVSAEGMGLYIRSRKDSGVLLGTAATLVYCLPGATRDCRFRARVMRQTAMNHGVVLGLHLEHDASIESLRQQQALIAYVGRRSEEADPFGRAPL